MENKTKRRGRPPTGRAKSAAERMRAYRRRKKAAGLKQTRAWVPKTEQPSIYSDHAILDARSLALHCTIAQKIVDDPSIIERAKQNLERWASKHDEPPHYIEQWREILSQSPDKVLGFIVSMSQKAIQLRQSSPFAGVLNNKERKKIYDAFRA